MALTWLRKLAYRLGYDFTLRKLPQYDVERRALGIPRDLPQSFAPIYRDTAPYTMTSVERMFALYDSVRHVLDNGIPGALVECGVWKGGSAMLMAETAKAAGVTDREIWLYDTFAGMTEPSELDIRSRDQSETHSKWEAFQREDHNEWTYAPLDEVKANMAKTGYPQDRLHYVVGPVEETLPGETPDRIALLRLDTDWYRSTYHEMAHLYPLVAPGGIVIIDDYGSFEGSRQAIDEYFEAQGIKPYLHRIDTPGRLFIKPADAAVAASAGRNPQKAAAAE
jgi:hypothetical protein